MKKYDFNKSIKTFIILALILNVSIFGTSFVAAARWDVGNGQTYNTIQSAIDNANTQDNDIIVVHSGTYSENVIVNKKLTIISNSGDEVKLKPTKSGFTIINNLSGDGSGSVIKGFNIFNSPGGTGVNISANYCKVENNWITGGNVGIFTIGNRSQIKYNTISKVFNTSIQAGNSTLINSSGNLSLIFNSPNNCLINNNKIIGGISGVSVLGNQTRIINNIISGTSDNGIAIFGTYPIISGNKIMDMVGMGSKTAISLASIGFGASTGVIIKGNRISNIKSLKNETKGIDAFAMSMNEKLDNIDISGNILSNINGFTKSTAISMVGLALGGKISNINLKGNKILKMDSRAVNGSSTGISVVVIGLESTNNKTTLTEKLNIAKNKIFGINSLGTNGTSTGISFVGLSKGNVTISNNHISNFRSDIIAAGITSAGIEFTDNETHVKLVNNLVSDLSSNKITSGIQSVTLGNVDYIHNAINLLKSSQSKAIAALTFKKSLIMGNNLQGVGNGEGVALKGPDATISYNRIVNFQHYIQNIGIVEFMEFSKGVTWDDAALRQYLISQKVPADKIDAIIAHFNKVVKEIDKMIGNNAYAPYNWFGTNQPPSDNFIKGNGTLNYYPWLLLNIKAAPSTIYIGQSSVLTADVYQDSAGVDHSSKADLFFSGHQVEFGTDLGSIENVKFIRAYWINGLAQAIYRANEGPGIAKVTATDYQTVFTNIKILGGNGAPDLNAGQINIGTQITGYPINYLLLAFIILFSGLLAIRRK